MDSPTPSPLPKVGDLPWKVDEDAGLFMLRDVTDEYLGEIDVERHADLIVRAVNAHSALVEALKAIVANSEEENEWDAAEKLGENLHTAMAALALAEPK